MSLPWGGCGAALAPDCERQRAGAEKRGVGGGLGDGAAAGVAEREIAAALRDRPRAGERILKRARVEVEGARAEIGDAARRRDEGERVVRIRIEVADLS